MPGTVVEVTRLRAAGAVFLFTGLLMQSADFDPAVVTPNLVSSNEVRTLSPTGTNGFRDFDPSVTYPGSR